MTWNYLLVKELTPEESDLPGFVACRHNGFPEYLDSIDNLFDAPWESGGETTSVKIMVVKTTTKEGDEYQFVRQYTFHQRPIAYEGDGIFHRTLREGCRPNQAQERALEFIFDEFEANSFQTCYINRGDEWKVFRAE